jgi:WD40 repeat protein
VLAELVMRRMLNRPYSVSKIDYSPDGKIDFSLDGKIAFLPDGKILAIARSFELVTWDVQSRAELQRMPCPMGDADQLAFSPDGKTLALATDRRITLWNIST